MKQRGFTLLEVLVAIAIFALMYVLAQEFFNQMIEGRNKLDSKAAALAHEQRTMLYMVQDFEQLIARPVRDRFGDLQPALVGNNHRVAFTHLGWANPFSLQHRSTMQRVMYVLHDNQLIRRYWPALDINVGTRPVDTLLLDHVESVTFRYLAKDDATGSWQWYDVWPSVKMGQEPPLLQALPQSVECTIVLEDGTELHRYFRLVINPWRQQA